MAAIVSSLARALDQTGLLTERPRRFVAGIEGTSLRECERDLFARNMPAGFILFARNCETEAQLSALVQALKDLDPTRDVPVLIDQEGGRVMRIKPPMVPAMPPFGRIGDIARDDPIKAQKLAFDHGCLTGAQLNKLGINVNCSPCVDVAVDDVTWAIGDRSFGGDPDLVARLGREVMSGLKLGGVLPVIKHLPGHGRATVDSHLELPRVTASLDDLKKSDFKPFIALRDAPFAMTAHIVFDAIDPKHPATQSARIINDIIRGDIGFDGLLFSDDLSMEALDGSIVERAQASLEAGCDLALHCNGKADELEALLNALEPVDEGLLNRLNRTMASRKAATNLDAAADLENLLAIG